MSLTHNDLPLPEYDHVPLGHLPARIAPLTIDQLQQLIDYETQHGKRLPVQTVLEQRMSSLKDGAEPHGSVHAQFAEILDAADSPSVTPETTTAPAINPTSHGDPTNPS